MTKEELEKASVEDLLDNLDYCGYDSYYASYREIIIIEIKNRLEENEQLKTENEQLKKELLTYKNSICNKECAEVWGESGRLKEENEQLKKDLERANKIIKQYDEYLENEFSFDENGDLIF